MKQITNYTELVDFNSYFSLLPKSIFSDDINSDIAKLIKIYNNRMTTIDVVIEQLRTLRDLNSLTGALLDMAGKYYSVNRDGSGDDDYRIRIAVRMVAKFTSGTINDMINVGNVLPAVTSTNITDSGVGTVSSFLDGMDKLNGNWYFRPYVLNTAMFDMELNSTIETVKLPQPILPMLDGTRSAGVDMQVIATLENAYHSIGVAPTHIAIGDGGLIGGVPRAVTGAETGLYNEIGRYAIESTFAKNGFTYYRINFSLTEIVGTSFNEIMMFKFTSPSTWTRVSWLKTFNTITKHSGLELNIDSRAT